MLYLVGLVALAAVFMVLFAPVKVIVSYAENAFSFSVRLYEVCIYSSKRKKSSIDKKETADDFERNTEKASLKLKDFAHIFKTAVKLLKKFVSIKDVSLRITVGTGDAAVTAVSIGALWAAVYNFIGIAGRIVYIDKHKVEITPDYVNEAFYAEGNCIITSRLVYIIIIMVTILMKIKSRRSKNE